MCHRPGRCLTRPHATDDWRPGTLATSNSSRRHALSKIDGSTAKLDIRWTADHEVEINGWVYDTAGDNQGAQLQIQYQIFHNGGWYWHNRTMVKAAGNNKSTQPKSQVSNYPTRYLSMRACRYNSSGTVTACDQDWK